MAAAPGAGRGRARTDACANPSCVSKRMRLGGLAAALAITKNDLFERQAREGAHDVRRGGAGRMSANAARISEVDEREKVLAQAARLRGLCAEMALTEGEEERASTALLTKLHEELKEVAVADDAIDEARAAQIMALGRMVDERTKLARPLECAICTDDLTPEDVYLGKDCFHPYHASCVLSYAQQRSSDTGDYRAFFRPVLDAEGRSTGRNELIPEMADRFPGGGLAVPCPTCRNGCFADHAFFGVNSEALALRGQDASAELAGREQVRADERIAAARAAGHLLLLDAECAGADGLVMLVEAHAPGSKKAFDFFQLTSDPSFRALQPPLEFDKEGTHIGGKGWYRKRVADETLDSLPAGAVLRKTEPSFFKAAKPGAQRKIRSAGGVYKVDLPRPTTPDAPAASASADDVA